MKPSEKTLGRLFTAGHTAKGLIYLLVGGFALAAVIGASGETNGPKAVIDWISNNSFGQVMLGLVGSGLAAYALWRFYLAIFDPAGESDDTKGKIKRAGWVVSGLAYAGLSLYAFKELLSGSGGKDTKEDMIAMLLRQPWGQVAVAIIGGIVVAVGFYQLYRAVTDTHMEEIKEAKLSSDQQDAFRYTGRIGLGARFVVYSIMGYFLIRAAFTSNAGEFRGLGESLSVLKEGSVGFAMLAVTGAGLVAYGLFMLMKARYGAHA